MTGFSDRLKKAREMQEISQVELAKALGITQPSYYALEQGRIKKIERYLSTLAENLGVSIEWLLGEVEDDLVLMQKRHAISPDKLREVRNKSQLTQEQIAQKVGISRHSYMKIENGQVKHTAYLHEIADALGVPPVDLLTDESRKDFEEDQQSTTKDANPVRLDNNVRMPPYGRQTQDLIPVLNWVAAGSWSDAQEQEVIEYLPRLEHMPKTSFALIVVGESMLPDFKPNDYIFVDPTFPVCNLRSGDLVVVREATNQATTFKQVVIGSSLEDMYLRPLNPEWREQKIEPQSDWELIGKVVYKMEVTKL